MSRTSHTIRSVIFATVVFLCVFELSARDYLTVDELVESKETFHTQTVTVMGTLHLELEGDSLYGSKNRLWLDMYIPPYTEESVLRDEARIKKYIEIFQDKSVLVTGVFNKNNKGHFGGWDAGFDYVEDIKPFEPGS